MSISAQDIKKLRDMTSAAVMDCKKALSEANGDINTAVEILKKKGIEIAAKKASRATAQGKIGSYIHAGGKIGVLVELNCETDFVANNDMFNEALKNISMHIAAMNPKYLKIEDVSQDELNGIANKEEFAKENCLLSQPFVKDESKTISEYITEVVSKTGENVVLKRFVRFELGE